MVTVSSARAAAARASSPASAREPGAERAARPGFGAQALGVGFWFKTANRVVHGGFPCMGEQGRAVFPYPWMWYDAGNRTLPRT